MDGMQSESNPSGVGKVTRRSIAKQVFCVAATGASLPLEPLLGANEAAQAYQPTKRMAASFRYRMLMARKESVNPGFQADNGDSRKFTDFSCAYSKALLHDALGVPNKDAVNSLLNAFQTGAFADFENVIIGTPGGGGNSKLNGPQSALAFDLEGMDSHATVIPPAPKGGGPFYDARGHGTEVLP